MYCSNKLTVDGFFLKTVDVSKDQRVLDKVSLMRIFLGHFGWKEIVLENVLGIVAGWGNWTLKLLDFVFLDLELIIRAPFEHFINGRGDLILNDIILVFSLQQEPFLILQGRQHYFLFLEGIDKILQSTYLIKINMCNFLF